ncbi:hypothetical protein GGS23DRAFT_602024 [Durotheca rogersii]|uniref:uncharacterized protein n=1 Tax=Durotheca rogersii TaxID=419775 RepID=UPI002220D324|nr:uncharacterized protein GGS23DRAFT_602024 [Durotheca rogersii]KAI5868106.1 hypothetical protein GGS23DRAFT_602024 [Durotheca rogersii]
MLQRPPSDSPGGRNRGPRLSRARACAECKRHKIKCEVRRGESSCNRCLRSGTECAPYDPSQRILDEHAAWKAEATAHISQLQAAVRSLLQHDRLPDLSSFTAAAATTSRANSAPGAVSAGSAAIEAIDMRRDASPERPNDDPGLVPAPMGSLYELTKVANLRDATLTSLQTISVEEDLISRGVISAAEGQHLFALYLENHHPLLWGGVLFPYRTLDAVRQASALLSTAVMTVAALHTPGRTETLQTCYDAFVALVTSSCLSRRYSIDDVRALCLAAFYLPNLSWRLSGQAVRMAAEMNMHQSFQKLIDGDPSHHERVRLWYALYVCDRHFSIAYGRPSAMYGDTAIDGVESFLRSPSAEAGDVRLSAQVALFKILTEAYLEHGSDQNQALSEHDLDGLRTFNISIEQWRLLWQPRSLDSVGIGSYPSKGVVMYYHFARFQLNSLALRGIRWPSAEPLSPNRREAAMTAIAAAMNTLMYILEENDLRRALNGVPLFTHAMVTFCATFLLKMAAIWAFGSDDRLQGLGLGFNLDGVLHLTRRSADLLSEVAEKVSEKHLTRLIVAGIREMIRRVTVSNRVDTSRVAAGEHHESLRSGIHMGADAAIDPAPNQIGNGTHEMIYNMDLDSLVGLLEYGSGETFLSQFPAVGFESWAAPT